MLLEGKEWMKYMWNYKQEQWRQLHLLTSHLLRSEETFPTQTLYQSSAAGHGKGQSERFKPTQETETRRRHHLPRGTVRAAGIAALTPACSIARTGGIHVHCAANLDGSPSVAMQLLWFRSLLKANATCQNREVVPANSSGSSPVSVSIPQIAK